DFHTVTRSLVNNHRVLHCSGAELRLRFIQLPGSHLCVVGQANRCSGQTQHHCYCDHSRSHIVSSLQFEIQLRRGGCPTSRRRCETWDSWFSSLPRSSRRMPHPYYREKIGHSAIYLLTINRRRVR